jgi:probable rRNA maturation factor
MAQPALDIQAVVPLEEGVAAVLQETVAAVLAHEQVSGDVSLSLLLTDDEQMRQLNRDFAGLDEPTDVLSFPVGDEMMPEELAGYLGDIAISMMKAERQAKKGGHTVTAELQLLVVHGVLHLLGYDHYDAEEKAAMWAAQRAVLEGLGVEVVIPEN